PSTVPSRSTTATFTPLDPRSMASTLTRGTVSYVAADGHLPPGDDHADEGGAARRLGADGAVGSAGRRAARHDRDVPVRRSRRSRRHGDVPVHRRRDALPRRADLPRRARRWW